MTKQIYLNEKELTHTPFTIGKHPSNDFQLKTKTASRFHAKIIETDRKFILIDIGSKNGIYCNEQCGRTFVLNDNDSFILGNDTLKVKFKNIDNKKPQESECEIDRIYDLRLHELHQSILKVINNDKDNLSMQELVNIGEENYFIRHPCKREEKQKLRELVKNEIFGLGPLEKLLKDTELTEIMVNAYNEIYVEKNGQITKTKHRFLSEKTFINMLERIISLRGGRLDENMPYIDTRMDDGSRLNAIIPPASMNGPKLSIRKFNNMKYDFNGLLAAEFIPKKISEFLKSLVLKEKNLLISGNTGSGKTTLLNALSEFIDSYHRIITIEDAVELELKQEHLIQLQSRRPNVEGEGEIKIRDLLRNALRMRPDRIIVGECRGAETLDMIQAMSTGHYGSMSTIHANSARDALKRIETIILLDHNLNPRGLREQISSAIDFVIHTKRDSKGRRLIAEIIEINGIDEDIIIYSTIYDKEGFKPELSIKMGKEINA